MSGSLFDARRQACACKKKCGDVREIDDHPRAVCKGLPLAASEELEVVLVHRSTTR